MGGPLLRPRDSRRVHHSHPRPYAPGESFDFWFWKLGSHITVGGWALTVFAWQIGYLYEVRIKEVTTPAWLTAPWLTDHWHVSPALFLAAAIAYGSWWMQHRDRANHQLEDDDRPTQEIPALPAAPVQVGWSLDRNAPEWQEQP